jgi:TPR repeat protein
VQLLNEPEPDLLQGDEDLDAESHTARTLHQLEALEEEGDAGDQNEHVRETDSVVPAALNQAAIGGGGMEHKVSHSAAAESEHEHHINIDGQGGGDTTVTETSVSRADNDHGIPQYPLESEAFREMKLNHRLLLEEHVKFHDKERDEVELKFAVTREKFYESYALQVESVDLELVKREEQNEEWLEKFLSPSETSVPALPMAYREPLCTHEGCRMYKSGQYKKAQKLLEKHIKDGEGSQPCVLFYYGKNLSCGLGVDKQGTLVYGMSHAYAAFRRSAEQGHCKAQTALGVCYARGRGIEKDAKRAAQYFMQAADKYEVGGMFQLGCCHRDGRGVESSLHEAFKLFKIAAELGYDKAQYALAQMYASGYKGASEFSEVKTVAPEQQQLHMRQHRWMWAAAFQGHQSAYQEIVKLEADKFRDEAYEEYRKERTDRNVLQAWG